MALFCRKRSSRETERWRGVHKLNFKFSCWITIVLTTEWQAKKNTFQENNFKKKTHISSLLPIFFFFFIYSCSLLAQTQFTLCHFHHFFFTKQACSLSSGEKNIGVGWVNGSAGKSCSGLKSHLVEVVMRADVRWGGVVTPTPILVDRCGKCHVWATWTMCGCIRTLWFSTRCCFR